MGTATAAGPDDLAAACRALASTRPALARDDAARRFLDLLRSGEFDPAGLFVTRGAGGTVRGAVLAQTLPGALGILFPPRTTPHRPADAEPLLAAALDWLRGRGVKVCQSFAPRGDRADEPTLARAGFRHVTAVVHLRRERRDDPEPAGALTFEPVDDANRAAFTAALLRSHDGSLDCPELTGTRTEADLLAGFHAPPPKRPDWWALARHGGEAVGVVLLEPGTEIGAVELSYLGLVPAARGRGWGEGLLRFALRAAGDARALTLSVDARNGPARRLYERHGFREADRREVFLWRDGDATSVKLPGIA
ncbi:GNAT family N-acetyltransferase [Urbifossiella limnaea]|uniref:Mycothiol acetyltransferase n=1 Tax=Urbifossiella limnaea TaxID=2528023 RepID=A0A517XLH6_9BACT|nr:GNAT family N-acetyltransferase [Urbifossiella limnaea]QDU18362.1 Mycothiol acetyltransferase [Urbifossiella limnaea]